MSGIIQPFIDALHQLSQIFSLPWFTFFGAMIEEVIAPIPSPLVMTLAGSLAASEKAPWTYLGLLALIGAIGKTIGSLLIYVIADKGEDLIMGKFGKYLELLIKRLKLSADILIKGGRMIW